MTSGNATSYYFLGGRLIGMKEGAANVTYVHQDHLTGTSVVSNSAGGLVSSIAYAPFGATRAGAVSTDIQFTGQRLDSTGLYFYNARYYDPQIGRFISADSIVPDFSNPQALNRYTYVVNNPTSAIDPSGHDYIFVGGAGSKWTDQWWTEMLIALDWDPTKDRVLFISDQRANDPISAISWGSVFEITDQYSALEYALENGGYEDIKIIGHSEGAATTAKLLSNIANNKSYLAGANARTELRGAAMIDMPAGVSDFAVTNWNDSAMKNLPKRLTDAKIDIGLADIRGTFIRGGEIEGWGALSHQIYDPFLIMYGFDPQVYLNPDFMFGHSSVILEPKTIDIVRNTFGID